MTFQISCFYSVRTYDFDYELYMYGCIADFAVLGECVYEALGQNKSDSTIINNVQYFFSRSLISPALIDRSSDGLDKKKASRFGIFIACVFLTDFGWMWIIFASCYSSSATKKNRPILFL